MPRAVICRIAIFVTAVSSAQLAAAGAQELSSNHVRQVDSVIRATIGESKAPAISVAIAIGDKIMLNKGYGTADLEHDVPATAETLYRTASISKWMTATAAMRLVEQGKLDLDAPVQQYCPTFPDKQWTITPRHLLMHRAGVRHYWGANGERPGTAAARAELRERQQKERIGMTVRHTDVITPLEQFKDDSLLFEPGARFQYTSHGYRLMGCVVQGAASRPYRQLMQEEIFDRAGMTRTTNDDAFAIIPHRAAGYVIGENGEPRRARFRDVSENLPAGGHLSTSEDLVKFARAFDAGELVKPASIQQMTAKPTFANAEDAAQVVSQDSHYGFGINVATWEGRQVLSHTGGQSGTSTILVLFPAEDLAIAVMSNLENFPDRRGLVYDIAKIVLGG